MSLLCTASLNERGLGHLYPITLNELSDLSKRPDWGAPGSEPTPELLKATAEAVERTKALLAAEQTSVQS